MKNAILSIEPYWHEDTWIFDDDSVGLEAEPFITGIPEMIDYLVQDIRNAELGFRLYFADFPFPDYQMELEWVREQDGGHWYRLPLTGNEGWLCPALYYYFDTAPKKLYVKAEQLPRMVARTIQDWERTRQLKESIPTNVEINSMVRSVIDDFETTRQQDDADVLYRATHALVLKIAATAARAAGIAFDKAPDELIIESLSFSLLLDKETINSLLALHQNYEKILNGKAEASLRSAMKWFDFLTVIFDIFLNRMQREYSDVEQEKYFKERDFLRSSGMFKRYLRERLDIQGEKGKEYVVFKNVLDEEEQYHIGLVKGRILLALMKLGDELWYFRSSEGSWQAHMGREGIAIIREGTVFEHVMIRRN